MQQFALLYENIKLLSSYVTVGSMMVIIRNVLSMTSLIFYSNVKPCYPIKAICELCLKGEKAGVICLTTARVGKTTSARKAVTFSS